MILSIETSTHNCSVALHHEGTLLACREQAASQYIHSEKLHLFIKETMQEAQIEYRALKAIAVGSGPGSYTGLRIGISAAKGLAYTLGIHLISATGTAILAAAFRQMNTTPGERYLLAPMIDARRMEVYTALYEPSGKKLNDVKAEILSENTYSEYREYSLYILGDARTKALRLGRVNWQDGQIQYPSAQALGILAYEKYVKGQFEDVAYFEPFYLKSFKAGKPRKLI